MYIVYLQRNTLSIRSEGDELTCGNLQYSILVMFLAFSAKVVVVTLLVHLIFNTQQKVASMHPSTAHCATFSIKKVPKKYWLVLVLTIFPKKNLKSSSTQKQVVAFSEHEFSIHFAPFLIQNNLYSSSTAPISMHSCSSNSEEAGA